jgi:hypothetical protein
VRRGFVVVIRFVIVFCVQRVRRISTCAPATTPATGTGGSGRAVSRTRATRGANRARVGYKTATRGAAIRRTRTTVSSSSVAFLQIAWLFGFRVASGLSRFCRSAIGISDGFD